MATMELTKENFEQTVTGNPIVIVDFWAPWCGPCRSFAPVFEKASEVHTDVVFAKVNSDEQQELAGAFNIRSSPDADGVPRTDHHLLGSRGFRTDHHLLGSRGAAAGGLRPVDRQSPADAGADGVSHHA